MYTLYAPNFTLLNTLLRGINTILVIYCTVEKK